MINRTLIQTIAFSTLMSITSFANPFNTQSFDLLSDQQKEILNNVSDTYIMYTTTNVNLRCGANTDSDVVQTLPSGVEVDCLADVDGWTVVLYGDNDFYYFIKSDYLSETKPTKSYTDEDLYVLAHILSGEMHDQPWEDNIYTASVLMNRVNGDDWWTSGKHTVKAAAFKQNQYSCIKDGNYYREPSETNWKAAKYVLENGSQIPSNVVFQSGSPLSPRIWKKTKHAYYCYE